ncbi:MAG: hypothetical protein K6G63_06875 [Eubacterium sp.]|nr:hypothetical protein [Eubacterium sp.]
MQGCDIDSLPDSIRELKDYAVGVCAIKDGHLPTSLESMGKQSLICSYGKVKISKDVKNISSTSIVWDEETCDTNIGYEVDSENKYYKSDKNGWLYTNDGKTLIYADLEDTDYTIPKGVKTVYKKGLFVGSQLDFRVKIKGLDGVKVIK